MNENTVSRTIEQIISIVIDKGKTIISSEKIGDTHQLVTLDGDTYTVYPTGLFSLDRRR